MSGKNSGADKALNKNINEGAGKNGSLKRPSGAKRLKRGEPTERRIAEALIFLMEKNDYDKITVTDITKAAGISRMTYYRNYSSKDDILIKYFEDEWNRFLESAKSAPAKGAETFLTLLFRMFGEKKRLLSNMIKAERFDLLFNVFEGYNRLMITALAENGRCGAGDKYETIYKVGGIFYMIKTWIEDAGEESPEEMAEIALRLLREYRGSEKDPFG